MDTDKQKKSAERTLSLLSALIFVTFILLFSLFTDEINWVNNRIYGFGASEKGGGDGESGTQNATSAPTAAPKNAAPAKPAIDLTKPEVSNLPKTPAPSALIMESEPEFKDPSIPLFPELRIYTGEKWSVEKTDIRAACFKGDIYLYCRCYDKDSSKLVTDFSKKEGETSAWKDDSIEVFIMKEKDSKTYFQYVASASGMNHIYYFKELMQPTPMPDDFVKPECKVSVGDGGFDVLMKFNLKNLGIDTLSEGDTIYMQLARNYRGQGQDGTSLQLFPNYIYCDNRTGRNHHDRRGFQPLKFIKTAEQAK